MTLARVHQFKSIAFPVIGAGSGGFDKGAAIQIMQNALSVLDDDVMVFIVEFSPSRKGSLAGS
jgi:O-acetyl-ADP-ribose deacetylase (regulator of RNase III)